MIYMNPENSQTSDARRLRPNHTNEIDIPSGNKCVALSSPSIYYTWNNIKKLYRNNKFKILGAKWDEQFEQPNKSYSISDI